MNLKDSDILTAEVASQYFAPIIKYEERQFYVAKRGKPKWVRSGPVLREEEAAELEERSLRNLVYFYAEELRVGMNLKKSVSPGALHQLRLAGIISPRDCIRTHITEKGLKLLEEVEKEV